ncbi:MAG: hypothetical protein NC341_03565 [Blautia sp.]|nr:hypothetical protein [Blautia sp.]MCM1200675.1 hypothetical protein [Bacteroides fragilis]
MIEISKDYIVTGAEHSSCGSQMKWKQEGYWYKADMLGFESLAEAVVSHLMKHSNIGQFVEYEPAAITYEGRQYRGCRSPEFKGEKEELISVERLSKSYTGFGLARMLERIADVEERILYTVELVENLTGLPDFGVYLTRLLELDAFFLNVGRHTGNIMLLYDTEKKEYRFAPVFDMAQALFSDTKNVCPLEKGMVECYHAVTARPFSRDFDEQLRTANKLYDKHLKFDLSANEMINSVRDVLNGMQNGNAYQGAEKRRIGEIIRFQTKKYQYMFRK